MICTELIQLHNLFREDVHEEHLVEVGKNPEVLIQVDTICVLSQIIALPTQFTHN
jgi:hypothetical protein